MNCLIRNLRLTNIRVPFMGAFRTFETALDASHQKLTELTEEVDKLYKIVELELRGNEPAVLKSFAKFATTAGQHLDVQSKSWNLRKPVHERYTVLKVVHIYKKHMVQYETRTYYMFVQYKHLTGSTADTLLEYLERNLPEGVALKATKDGMLGLVPARPIGAQHFKNATDPARFAALSLAEKIELQRLPDYFKPPTLESSS